MPPTKTWKISKANNVTNYPLNNTFTFTANGSGYDMGWSNANSKVCKLEALSYSSATKTFSGSSVQGYFDGSSQGTYTVSIVADTSGNPWTITDASCSPNGTAVKPDPLEGTWSATNP